MTTYATGNPKTKKALKEAVANGEFVGVFSAGLGSAQKNGTEVISGPQYPAPHKWYAKVKVVDGKIVKVVS